MTGRMELQGRVHLRVYRGETLETEEVLENVVTDRGRDALARFMAGDLASLVDQVAFGAGLTPAAAGDIALENAIISRPVDELTVPTLATMRVAWSLPAGLVVDGTLSELGLWASDGTLVSRRVRAEPIPMDADIFLEGEWDLQVVGA